MPESLPTITSRDNPVIKRIRSLQRSSVRYAERAFIVEGSRAVLDGIEAGGTPEVVLLSDRFDPAAMSGIPEPVSVRVVDHNLLSTVAQTTTPQGIVAIFAIPDPPSPGTTPELSLVMDGVSDPGNAGTLLRTAAAAGVSRVWITAGTADPYNPKVVRAAMGAHFRVPVRKLESHHDIPGSTAVLLLQTEQATAYTSVPMTGSTCIVVGSEAHGVRFDFENRPVTAISLPMPGGTESLNAAVAGSIALYEALRQRGQAEV